MDKATATDFLYNFSRLRFTEACTVVTGSSGALRYGKVVRGDEPPNGTYWARVTCQIEDERQETLRLVERRWLTTGKLFIQLFCPVEDPNAPLNVDLIAELVRNPFRLYQGAEIEFTNPMIVDNVAAEPNWLRANVTCTYQYRQFM